MKQVDIQRFVECGWRMPPPPLKEGEFIAFRPETVEDRFFSHPLHSNCEVSSFFHRGRKCYACIWEARLHDPGDEDRG